jgi:hypothetical protein
VLVNRVPVFPELQVGTYPEVFTLLGCYTALLYSYQPFWDSLLIPFGRYCLTLVRTERSVFDVVEVTSNNSYRNFPSVVREMVIMGSYVLVFVNGPRSDSGTFCGNHVLNGKDCSSKQLLSQNTVAINL